MSGWKKCPNCECMNLNRDNCVDCGCGLELEMETKPLPDSAIGMGDRVEKVGGDYRFEGFVVSKFWKIPDEKLPPRVRFVVEDDRGVLHIYSEKNLRKIE